MEPRLPAALAVSSLVLLPSGPDTIRRATMHRARAPGWAPCGDHWRRGRDSNPRWSYPHTRFPSVLLRPLGHLSSRFFSHGGEEGIRTLGPREGSTVFETAPIDHSGTSPHGDRHCTRSPTGCPLRAFRATVMVLRSWGLEGVWARFDCRSGPHARAPSAPAMSARPHDEPHLEARGDAWRRRLAKKTSRSWALFSASSPPR